MDRTAAQLKIAALLVIDRHAHDVAGQQVGRELQAAELAAQREGQRAHERRFTASGQVVQQHMAAGKYGHQNQFDLAVLADDDFLCFLFEAGGVLGERVHDMTSFRQQIA